MEKMNAKNKQLALGIKIESEHKRTVNFIKNYVKKYKKLPPNKKIYASIAADHYSEHKNYYTKLKKAKL
jgi:sulfur relay (sulfurtransferase) DsrC/TusE family protein